MDITSQFVFNIMYLKYIQEVYMYDNEIIYNEIILPPLPIVQRQNGKRGLESGFGSAGYANGI